MRRSPSGFTLIELLVAIAIIGILSAVVLIAANSARQKGINAGIQADLQTVRKEAEIYNINNGNYGRAYPLSLCSTAADYMFSDDLTIKNIVIQLMQYHAGCFASVSPNAYAMWVPLIATSTAVDWCIDSKGNSEYAYPAAGYAGGMCP